MTTIADLVNDTRARLSGTFADTMNTLGADYVPGSGTVTLGYDAVITPGAVLSCGENTWYVLGQDQTNARTLTVVPSYDGGPDVAKTSGAYVRVKPRVTDWSIFVNLRDQIMAMCSPANGLGRIDFWMEYGITLSGTYPPPTGVVPEKLLAAYGFDGQKWWQIKDAFLELGAVRVFDDRWSRYCFVYREPFKEVTSFTQDAVNDIGLSESMLDIPVLGAAGLALLSIEARRNQVDAQGDTRRASEVQAGSNMGSGREMLRMRDQRIAHEAMRGITVAGIIEAGA